MGQGGLNHSSGSSDTSDSQLPLELVVLIVVFFSSSSSRLALQSAVVVRE